MGFSIVTSGEVVGWEISMCVCVCVCVFGGGGAGGGVVGGGGMGWDGMGGFFRVLAGVFLKVENCIMRLFFLGLLNNFR